MTFERYVPPDERTREALCTLGNGRFGSRGATSLVADPGAVHYPGTYAAGIYDRGRSVVEGTELEYEELVNLPNWLPVRLAAADGGELSPDACETLDYRQELDLARGFLRVSMRLRAPDGHTIRLIEHRFVHQRANHLAGLQLAIEIEHWTGPLHIQSLLDGRVDNSNADEYEGLDRRHFERFERGGDASELIWLRTATRRSRIEVSLAARTHVTVCDGERERRVAPTGLVRDHARAGLDYTCEVARGTRVTIEKLAAIYTSRDAVCEEPTGAAIRALRAAPDFETLSRLQEKTWRRLWHDAAVELPDHTAVLGALRLHLFHIIQAVSPHCTEMDSSIPARGFHGENYHGHIFWDESFVFWVLTPRWPSLARTLLRYRYRRLDEARARARELGLRGAMFPWRSASDGREVTEPLRRNPRTGRWIPDHSHLQRHVNAAIVYNAWQYLEWTADREYLAEEGAELILLIALFWSSAAQLEADGRYHLRGVVGPDEFHEAYPGSDRPGVDDNAYTNIMAVWTLLRAREVLARLPATERHALQDQLEIDSAELERWDDITRRMAVTFQTEGRIVDQFEGFSRLAPFAWDRYRARYRNIQRLDDILNEEGDTTNRYQVCKQPDVLMLFYLLSPDELHEIIERLGYAFDPDAYARNVDYYLERSTHGSTLSRVVAAWVLCRLDGTRSWSMLNEALGSDLCDVQHGSTREGVHIGAMAGAIDVCQRAYLGLTARSGLLGISPQLPRELSELQFRLRYHGQWLSIRATRERVWVQSDRDGPGIVRLQIAGEVHELAPGSELTFELAPDART